MSTSPTAAPTQPKRAPSTPQVRLTDHMLMAYPTPIVVYPWPDSDSVNADLRDLVLLGERSGPGVVKSNIGGWHSELDLFSSDAPAVRTLMRRIEMLMVDVIGFFVDRRQADQRFRFSVEGWANLLRQGGYYNVHNHGNSHWSGVYYVTGNPPVPGHPMSGKLEFVDPRPAATMLMLDNLTIYGRQLLDPQPGTMVLFPSWLQHQVHPYFGSDERISIAFNVVVTPVKAATPGSAETSPPTRDRADKSIRRK